MIAVIWMLWVRRSVLLYFAILKATVKVNMFEL